MCEWVSEYIIQIDRYLTVGSEGVAHLALHRIVVEGGGGRAEDINPRISSVGIDIAHTSWKLDI